MGSPYAETGRREREVEVDPWALLPSRSRQTARGGRKQGQKSFAVVVCGYSQYLFVASPFYTVLALNL